METASTETQTQALVVKELFTRNHKAIANGLLSKAILLSEDNPTVTSLSTEIDWKGTVIEKTKYQCKSGETLIIEVWTPKAMN